MRCVPPREENFNSLSMFLPQYVNENLLSASKVGAVGLYTGTCAHTVHTMSSQTGPSFVHSVRGSESVLQGARKRSRWLALRLLLLL